MATELKVCDLELACYAEVMEKWAEIDSVMADYLKILANIKEKAIKSGEIHEAIDRLHWYAEWTYENMQGSGNTGAKLTEKFLKKIDDTDLNLYRKA